ncbi:type II CAAX endopeptidase family protein [Halomicroarcula sp. GCM10025709]|uniref:CPBP family intramembrane glutamic endopeptidase n=1 Tax=Haloarcula TaxID=2237 RepID=UPI0024C38954|nr:type II CAAX endopeptidase family protein [Halomicroarcula sp. YJ-61-S]
MCETTDTLSGPRADSDAGSGRLRAVLVALGLLVVGLGASIVVGIVFTVPLLLFGADVQSPTVFLLLAAVGQLAFLVVGLSYVGRYGGVTVRRPSRRDTGYLVGGLVAALIAATGLSVVVTVLGIGPSGSVFDDPITTAPWVALALAGLSIVLVAPAEELLFRGAIQGRLRKSFGPVGAVGGASVIFGSIHLLNYTGSIVGALSGVVIVTVGGAIFGTIYERTGNLLVPIGAHGGYNAVLLTVAFLAS